MVFHRELTLHSIDFTLCQVEVVAIHVCSTEVVIISWIVMDYCFVSVYKNQIFSKIWTTATYHFHCICRSGDRIFEERFSTEGKKEGLVIMHVLSRLTERLFGVTSKHKTGGVISHRHCGAVVVTSLVEGCAGETVDAGLVQQL